MKGTRESVEGRNSMTRGKPESNVSTYFDASPTMINSFAITARIFSLV
jgi:hypothetical protein